MNPLPKESLVIIIDQLTNAMEVHDETSFVSFITENTELSEAEAKILFGYYWKIDALARVDNNDLEWDNLIFAARLGAAGLEDKITLIKWTASILKANGWGYTRFEKELPDLKNKFKVTVMASNNPDYEERISIPALKELALVAGYQIEKPPFQAVPVQI